MYILSSMMWAGVATVVLLLVSAAIAVGGYAYIATQVPSPDNLWSRSISFKSTKIYDRHGELLYEIIDPTGGRRTIVPLEDMSQFVIWATVATEDSTFFRNPGFNPFAILRALYYDVTEGEIVSGASGITQQLALQLYLRREQTLERKVKEAVLAAEITRRYTKEEVLEIYLNGLYYGNLAYGTGAAAETYFGKEPADLTLAEAALLAGLPQSPVLWDPYVNPEQAKRRRAVVLGLMASAGFITPEQADLAAGAPLTLRPRAFEIKAPHFVMYVRQMLEQRYGTGLLYRAGLQVHTTLDLAKQESAERIAKAHVAGLVEKNASNAALVSLDPRTGEILAMLGSVDFFDEGIAGQVNVPMQLRQPGSTVKPILYSAAFERGWNPASMLMDVRVEYPDGPRPPYVPINYDKKEHGPVSVRTALACSYNIPAVRTLDAIGIPSMLEMARRLGISSLIRPDYGLSLALGAADMPMFELVQAYATLANGGVRVQPTAIQRITDFEGNVLEEAAPQAAGERVLDSRIAFLITSILSDNEARAPAYGRQNHLVLSRPSAAKTGTTDDFRDAYVIGYTPDLVTGVWVGNSDNTPMIDLPGVRGAGPIWHNFMEEVLAGQPERSFEMPDGIVPVPVCPVSGQPVGPDCPPARIDLFLQEAVPSGDCPVHVRVPVCRESGQRATDACPADLVDMLRYDAFPLADRAWAEAHGHSQPPVETCGIHNLGTRVSITYPFDGQTVGGIVEIQGSAVISDYSHYLLEYGISHDPGGWGVIRAKTDVRVDGGALGFWDTRNLGNGPHTIRVQAVNARDQLVESRVRVYVFNEQAGAAPSPFLTSTVTPSPGATPTFVVPVTPSPWPSPTSTETRPLATATSSSTATLSPTTTPTLSPTLLGTSTPSLTATPVDTLAPTPTYTATPEPTATTVPGPTLVQLPSPSPTSVPTETPIPGPTLVVLPSPTPTQTQGVTLP